MQSTPFNLESVIAVLQKRGKLIAVFVFVALITATIAVLISPKYYRSGAIVVPANAALADKGRIFNGSIQNLYSFLGNGDDIEILLGIVKSDTVFYRLIDEFDLVNYYQSKGDNTAIKRKNTLKALEKDLKIEKTEFNQLKISIYTKEAILSANIVNNAIAILQEIEQQIWKQVYQNSLHQLERSEKDLENQYRIINDSISNTAIAFNKEMFETKRQSILEQLKQFQKSENELKLALSTTPPSLYIIEKAFPSVSKDRPLLLPTLLAVFFISLIFAIIAALVLERKQAG